MTQVSFLRRELGAQPLLLIRREVTRAELPGMLGECFGKLFGYAQKESVPVAGPPLARYVSMGGGKLTVEAAIPLAAAVPGQGEMEAGTLPGGPAAFALHVGPYEQLPETFAAMEKWIVAQGWRTGGAPWESYVTDPAQCAPADLRTEIYWPLSR